MSNHIYYLDSSVEYGSLTILKQLNISLKSEKINSTSLTSLHNNNNYQKLQILSNQHYLFREIKLSTSSSSSSSSATSITYYLTSTIPQNIYLDIRDSGDCWLRICLNSYDHITIPSNIYHKFSTSAVLSYPYELSYQLNFNSNNSNISNINLQDFLTFRYNEDIDTIQLIQPHTYRELICELCSQFYSLGWVTGTGGSISIRYGNRIFMTPSGVQKERIQSDELFVLDIDGNFLSIPPKKIPGKFPKLSDCSPLFLHSYRHCNAGAVLHSHDITCVLITTITTSNEFKISHQEMIKGIAGYGYHDELIIPIIENTAWECELADSLEQAILQYPKSYAVLVRDHGIYVWGDNWEQAKRHGECLHYLFNVAIQKYQLNITPIYSHLQSSSLSSSSTSSLISNGHGHSHGHGCDNNNSMEIQHQNNELQDVNDNEREGEEVYEGNHKRKRVTSNSHSNSTSNSTFNSHSKNNLIYKTCQVCCDNIKSKSQQQENSHSLSNLSKNYKYIVMDIEGTTTPITFVKDVLFPFSRNNVESYLRNHWSLSSTQQDIHNLCLQATDDINNFPNKESLPSYLQKMIELSSSSSSSSFSENIPEEFLGYILLYIYWNIDNDRKVGALKSLQGKIWRNGYETNQLQSIVYSDIPKFFQRSKLQNKSLYIYSSGSMEAQYLLFKYSNYGDLRSYLSCYFDTNIGHKRQSKSYSHIFQSLGANQPNEILFVTDIIEEAYAAKEAGLDAILSNRPGNAPLPSNSPFPIITTFDML